MLLRLTPWRLACFVALAFLAGAARAADDDDPQLSAEKEALLALRGSASNVQMNRDGTVRFVRFSKSIVTNEHVLLTEAFPHLDYLAVVVKQVDDKGLAVVARLPNLDTLFLSDSGLTDAGMPALGGLPKLARLYLDRTQVTDRGLQSLEGLEALETLSLNQVQVTDRGLDCLASLKNLKSLSLNDCAVTDEAWERLARLSTLEHLSLAGAEVRGAGVGQLKALTKLDTLDLSRTKLGMAAAEELSALPQLRRLLLFDVPLTDSEREHWEALWASGKGTLHLEPAASERRNPWQRLLAGEPLRGASDRRQRPPAEWSGVELPAASERFGDAAAAELAPPPDFQRHVVPLLGRLGCNGRTCHGSFQGQGGFRLSMFGYDFAADIEALTGGDAPRVNRAAPDDSLIVRKPTLREDHEGGRRFAEGGWEHQLLLRWIAEGARGAGPTRELRRLEVTPAEIVFADDPAEARQLRCVAVWSDGLREDVTCLSRFQSNDDVVAQVDAEGRVRCGTPGDTHIIVSYDNAVTPVPVMRAVSDLAGDRYPDVPAPTAIDRHVVDKLSKLGIVPADVCGDEQFLRRVSLDLIGTLPTASEVQAFVADSAPDKRRSKVRELLETEAYVEWWTVWLSDLTGSNAQHLGGTDMNQPAAEQWNAWLRRRLRDNVGWDRIAAGIILAESRPPGQTYDEYAAQQSAHLRRANPDDFTALDNPMHYYWFRGNNQTPTDRALAFGYTFLGVRLQCAQCHKHPFDQWSQDDFEKFTQFFTRIKAGVAPDAKRAQQELKTKLGVPVKLDTAALRRQMYLRVSAEGLPIPWNEIYIERPASPKQAARLLGGADLNLSELDDPREPLMAWLLSEDNPYFARALVNRIWAHYFGRGIVEPPDNFNRANPPSNEPLLDELARGFVAHSYDLKWLHETIAASDTYQRSWQANETNRSDFRNFSRAQVRRMPAEVTIDAILQATAADSRADTFAENVDGRKISQHPKSIQARGIDFSLLIFGKPLRMTNCDCERQMQPTLLQSLYVRNDSELLGWLERPDGWLAKQASQWGRSLDPETTAAKPAAAKPADAKPADAKPEAGKLAPAVAETQLAAAVEQAYLRTVSRAPSDAERQRGVRHLTAADHPAEGLRDLMWALLNTQEFLTNH